jgi:hypothetical protein
MRKMSRKKAEEILYNQWEDGEIPSNFTEDHSEYSEAVEQLMKQGYVNWHEILSYREMKGYDL